MNREQRRRSEKMLRHNGKTKDEAHRIVQIYEMLHPIKKLQEGEKVRLNVVRIQGDVNYKRKTDEFRAFVEAHKDDTFTVKYDPKFNGNAILVCLAEDATEPKWLWHESDLERVKEDAQADPQTDSKPGLS